MRLFLLLFLSMALFAKTIETTKNNIHAFLPENGEITVLIGGELMNSTVDIFKIKESEISSNRAGYSSLGDMHGLDLELGYSFLNDWYVNLKVNQKKLQYLDATLENINLDLYLRYQVYQHRTKAIAFDVGICDNTAKDMSFNNANITYVDTNNVSHHADFVTLKDTYDRSAYMRAIASYKVKKVFFDAYMGFKYTHIENMFDGSLPNESNPELTLKLTRDEGMAFGGLGFRYTVHPKFIWELNYQYNRMFRDKDLLASENNHILDLNLLFNITKKASIYLGGKIMTNQFNGEINYLYTTYTKTKFDHKYGYADGGLIFKF